VKKLEGGVEMVRCPNCGSENVCEQMEYSLKELDNVLQCEDCGFEWYERETENWKIYFEEVRI